MLAFRPRPALAALALAALTACSTMAPKYAPDPVNVNLLRDGNLASARLGQFNVDARYGEDVNHLTIRGGTFQSPYEGSFVAYLKEALRIELGEARLLDPGSTVEVTGFMARNQINAAGFSTADARVEARFVVKRGEQVRYDKVLSAMHEWDSSFVGAIAIPKAVDNYPVVIHKLLTGLYSDKEFIAALQK